MRNTFRSLAIAAGLIGAAAAHADTAFNLILTPVGPGGGGTGSVSLSSAPSALATTTYDVLGTSGNTIDGLSFLIDGATFDLTSSQGDATIQFTGGQISDLEFDGLLIGATDLQVLGISGLGYDFGDAVNASLDESGTVSASATVTPEPSCLALCGTGVLAGLGVLRRRYSAL